MQQAPIARKVLMNSVAKLVGKRLHIANRAGKVHQDVRMRAGYRAVTEGTGPLSGRNCGVDPIPGKESFSNRFHLRMERSVRLQHNRPSI